MESNVLADFAEKFQRCWLCRCADHNNFMGRLHIHHIARGIHRKKAHDEECCLIRTCARCHDRFLDSMPIAEQLALVAIHNPAAYDRVRVNTLRRRAPDAVSEQQVIAEIAKRFHQLVVLG